MSRGGCLLPPATAGLLPDMCAEMQYGRTDTEGYYTTSLLKECGEREQKAKGCAQQEFASMFVLFVLSPSVLDC